MIYYFYKFIAIIERIITNRGYAIRDINAGKVAASIERIITNRGYSVWDSYACKPVATRERRTTNRGYAITDCYACKAGARIERRITNRGYVIRNNYFCNIITFIESIFVNLILLTVVVFWKSKLSIFSHVTQEIIYSTVGIEEITVLIYYLACSSMHLFCITSYISVIRRTCCNIKRRMIYYFYKFVATIERRITNRGYAITNSYARKAIANIKRIITNRGYAIGDSYACKSCAIIERIITNRGYSVQCVTVLERCRNYKILPFFTGITHKFSVLRGYSERNRRKIRILVTEFTDRTSVFDIPVLCRSWRYLFRGVNMFFNGEQSNVARHTVFNRFSFR